MIAEPKRDPNSTIGPLAATFSGACFRSNRAPTVVPRSTSGILRRVAIEGQHQRFTGEIARAKSKEIPHPELALFPASRITATVLVSKMGPEEEQIRGQPSAALDLKRAAMREAAGRFRAANPRIFGSVLQGTHRDGGDLDLLVDAPPSATSFNLGSAFTPNSKSGLACRSIC